MRKTFVVGRVTASSTRILLLEAWGGRADAEAHAREPEPETQRQGHGHGLADPLTVH